MVAFRVRGPIRRASIARGLGLGFIRLGLGFGLGFGFILIGLEGYPATARRGRSLMVVDGVMLDAESWEVGRLAGESRVSGQRSWICLGESGAG
jgi:hypothetical protein